MYALTCKVLLLTHFFNHLLELFGYNFFVAEKSLSMDLRFFTCNATLYSIRDAISF